MEVSWTPVVAIDIAGSILVLLISFSCAFLSRQWIAKKTDDVFRQYIHLLTLAIIFFAISRSFGHLIKQLLLLADMAEYWKQISPFSGAINTIAFVVIFAFGIYFHRFQKIQQELESYRNNLEDQIKVRTEELVESKQALENILNSSIPICITGKNFDLLQANESYYALWPDKGSEAVPLKCFESRPGLHCHTESCPLQQLNDGQPEVVQEVTKQIGGSDKEFILTARPIRNTDGELVGMVESFQDISDRKQAELALAAEREQLAVTLRSIGDGVITTDLDGKIVLINRITEQLTGWSQQDAVGRPVQEVFNIINEKTDAPSCNPVEKVFAERKIIELEKHTVLIAKNGLRYSIEDSAAPIFDKDSNIIGAILVFRDVTEKKRTDEELQKIKKLESVGVLAGGIAHDFNNILAAIMGNINLALRDESLSEKTQQLLDQAQKASTRARDLTQQLLTFAKGGQPIKQAASLIEIVRDSADFVLRGTKVACHYSFPENLWLVDIDKGQISQVVQNIILNACEAMPDGGTIEVSCKNISSTLAESEQPANYVELLITDTGHGIPAEILDQVFDPYFSTKQQGSGLGLAITHSIINKHNGLIRVKSTPGSGSSFTIDLPAATETTSTKEQHITPLPASKKAKILVMDDDEMVRTVTKEMLEEMGHEVLLADNGDDALQIYQQELNNHEPIELTIMDLTIPGGMGGQEAVQKFLALNSEAKTIVSSGYSNDPVMARFEDYGFSAAISKPHQYEELEKIINSLLN